MYHYTSIHLIGIRSLLIRFLVFLIMLYSVTSVGSEEMKESPQLRITVVFNNVPFQTGLTTAWGFSCVIEGLDKTLLFDTGGDGDLLLANMERLGVKPETVGAVVLSHIHSDHTGGLSRFLDLNSQVTVYLPESFPLSFKRSIEHRGARVERVGGPKQLLERVHSTGEMGDGIEEQALILDTAKGLVIITGCAHPGVTRIVAAARNYLYEKVYFLMGGFHLLGKDKASIQAIIRNLKSQGVEKVAPSHCTGEEAIALFREAWGTDFIEGGCGAVIELTESHDARAPIPPASSR
jgi:7,8-dihydropterin-6-yl-methyl-4-(beta-D-ribofuranosyl)aminobenzene 5'-phosphate synthase